MSDAWYLDNVLGLIRNEKHEPIARNCPHWDADCVGDCERIGCQLDVLLAELRGERVDDSGGAAPEPQEGER